MNNTVVDYAPVMIKLLQGILYQEDTTHWNLLLDYSTQIRDYFGKIGVELYLDEAEGYAYLRQLEQDSDEEQQMPPLPRLVRRQKLTYKVTLLCVLLREQLREFDTKGSDSTRLILTEAKIRETILPFFQERANEAKLFNEVDTIINQVVELGFLKRLNGSEEDRYEVRRILKAKISADKLVEIKQKLEAYAATLV